MSRSRQPITNTASNPSYFPPHPRHVNSQARTPAQTQTQTQTPQPSSRPDSQFTTIGALLSSPYDDNDSDSDPDEIQTPPTQPRAQLSPVKHNMNPSTKYTSPRKDVLENRIQSLEGVIEDNNEGYETTPSISFPQPTRPGLITPSRSPYSPPIRTPPTNTASPTQLRPIITLTTPFSPHNLPPPSSPISPYLAQPPSAPFTRPSPSRSSTSSTSDSIRGFEVMLEKKALFRGGEEELMSPFSPRKGGASSGAKRQESGLRGGGVKGMGRGVSGMDFWKRFSVSVRLDEVGKVDGKGMGKDSEWLAQARDGNKKIKYGIIISLILALCIGGALAAFFIIKNQNEKPDSAITPSKSL